jgi:protein-S-isoprenylcysteine O-methyltransferase Ste14
MALPQTVLQIVLSHWARGSVTGILIALAAIPISAVLWGIFTGRWSAESRRSRKLQADISAVNPAMRFPVPWVFILVYLVGVAVQRFVPIAIHSPDVSRIMRIGGFVLVGIGIIVAGSALGIFKKASTTTVPFERPSTLVTSGPYRFSRNPMYVALTLEYIGVAGARNEVWPLLLLPLVLVYVNFMVIPFEERRLDDVFGDAYQAYGARVRRWL